MLGNKGRKQNYREGGTRGGQDQFKWEDVKTDRDRENYLGNSLHAPTGRWQKGKDLLWYTRSSSSDNSKELELERARIRELDEERLNEALGIMKSRREESGSTGAGISKKKTHSLDDSELKQLLSRGSTERSTLDGERVAGLGAAPSFIHDHLTRISAIQEEINRLKKESSAPLNSEDRDSKKRKRDDNSESSSSDSDDSDDSRSSSNSSDNGDIEVSEKLSKKCSSSNNHSNKEADEERYSSKKSKRQKKGKKKQKNDKKEKKEKKDEKKKKKKHKKERNNKPSKDKK